MLILLWLAAPLAVAAAAMLGALWFGRTRRDDARSDAKDHQAYERFSEAVERPLPEHARHVVAQTKDRPSGVAVRPSQRSAR